MPTVPPPIAALLADLVRDLNDRLEHHVLTATPCTLHLVGADYDGDMAELHLQYPVDRSPRPLTPRMPPHVLLALLAGMSIALDLERGLGPSPATFDRLAQLSRSAAPPPGQRPA